MTTIDEKIAELEKRAAERGKKLNPEQVLSCSLEDEPESKPSKGLSDNRFPCSFMKSDKARNRRQLRMIESKTMASYVARSMGSDWSLHLGINPDRGGWGGIFLEHKHGLLLRWSLFDNRYVISVHSEYDTRITVSPTKTPRQIARDIRRRLLNAGALDRHAKRQADAAADRKAYVQNRLNILSIAKALGEAKLSKQSKWNISDWPESEVELPNCRTHVAVRYEDKYTLTIQSRDLELMREIGEYLKCRAIWRSSKRCKLGKRHEK